MTESKKDYPKGMYNTFSHPVRNGLLLGGGAALFIGALPVFIVSIVGYQLHKHVWQQKYNNPPKLDDVFQYFLCMSLAAFVVWIFSVVFLLSV